ncbi:hypothetical protein CA983_12180 [Streptomyces swartbergensis]|uniref:Transposase n=1 Tax=Streptomyces swartbergensis TaxID=487165 RepID=A0A243S5X6_9ACTN|nr:hypothetical protein CA983_12180 [Streptomyces swartbergensis]
MRDLQPASKRPSLSHRNAPLTPTGRLRLARCVVEDGWPLRRAAAIRRLLDRWTARPWSAARPQGPGRPQGRWTARPWSATDQPCEQRFRSIQPAR